MVRKLLIQLIIAILVFVNVSAQERIVTAGSSTSEIVCALGFCDNIIATDRTSKYPERLTRLPSIGYRTSISAEGVIAQNPDLVIFEDEYVEETLVTQLRSAGIKTILVQQKNSVASTLERIRTIAEALDKEAQGEELISQITSDLAILREKVEATSARPKVLCVYARGQGNMQVAGPDTGFSILELAGAQNAVPQIQGFKPLNAEALITANPDYILFFESGLQSVGGKDEVLKISGVGQTTAGRKGQIIALDGVLLVGWGPRIAQAASDLFELTHPEPNN